MKFQFITGNYEKDGSISIYARDEDYKKHKLTITGFDPYFYVPEGVEIPNYVNHLRTERGFKSIYNEELCKLVVKTPTDVGGSKTQKGFREYFERHFEADIDFIRRFMIDTGIKSGFEVETLQKYYNYKDLKPIDFSLPPLVCFLDIEVLCKKRFPDPESSTEKVIAITVWDTFIKKYATIILSPSAFSTIKSEWKSPEHLVIWVKTEEELFTQFRDYYDKIKPDIVSGWNIRFDVDYLKIRGEKIGVKLDFSSSCVFDLLEGYRRIFKKGGNRLKDVVIEEGIAKDVVSSEFHPEWYEKDIQKLIEYNKDDVRYCIEIDNKHQLIAHYWELKNFVGLEELESTIYHSVLIDTVLLRQCYGKKVLPSRPPKGEKTKSGIGAIVFEPEDGIYTGVGVVDVSRYYPSIILAYNLTPEKTKNGGVLPDLCNYLLNERIKYDKILEDVANKYGYDSEEYKSFEQKRQVVKDLLNAVSGYIDMPSSRIYVPDMAEFLRKKAREGLELLRAKGKSIGYPILYGDTDSLYVQAPIEKMEDITKEFNKALEEWCIKDGVKPLIKVKFEKYASDALWVEAKNAERGAKKRYGLRVIYDGGKKTDYIYIRGMDSVRSDTSRITRQIQPDIDKMILQHRWNEIIPYIRNIINELRSNKRKLEDIAIFISLHKSLEGYKTKIDYVEGARYANKYLGLDIRGGDTVKMLFVKRVEDKPPTKVVCFLDENDLPNVEVDYDRMIERTIKMKVENHLKLVGLRWDMVYGQTPLKFEREEQNIEQPGIIQPKGLEAIFR